MADDPNVNCKDLASILNKINKTKRSGLKLDSLSNLEIIKASKEARKALADRVRMQSKYDQLLKDGKITEQERAKIQERINKTTKNNGKAINDNLKLSEDSTDLAKLSLRANASALDIPKFLATETTCLSSSKADFTKKEKAAVGKFVRNDFILSPIFAPA